MVKKEDYKKIFKKEDLKGPIVKKIMRRISIPIALFLAKYTRITPNQVTFFTTILSFIAGYFFYLGEYKFLIIGALIFLLRFTLDYVDGSLARAKNMASDYGHWLDNASDELGKFIVFLTFSLGVYNVTGNPWAILLGFISFSGYILNSLTYNMFWRFFPFAEKVVETEKGKRKFLKQLFFIDPLITILISLAAFTNQIYLFLLITSVYSWIFVIGQFVVLSMKIIKHEKKK